MAAQTPYAETEAFLAVLEKDKPAFKKVLSELNIAELHHLYNAATRLVNQTGYYIMEQEKERRRGAR